MELRSIKSDCRKSHCTFYQPFFGFYISAIAVGQILKSAQRREREVCGTWSQRHLENVILRIFYI